MVRSTKSPTPSVVETSARFSTSRLTTAKEARAAVPDAQALLGFCTSAPIGRGPELHWVQVYSAGVDYCDLDPLRERGALMSNLQRLSSAAIADHAMAMLLAMSRGLPRYLSDQADGRWDPLPFQSPQAFELNGQTMLVVGLGGIGTQVARRANAFGMRVLATRNSSREGPEFVEYVGLPDELLTLAVRADVVVNSAPLTPSTKALFDAEFFAAMKPTAYFINVGRGKSAVTQDLVVALRVGQLAGAGLDVVDPEPLPALHPLWRMPNVIITPHVAGRSDQALQRMFLIVRENLRRYIHGEPMLSLVDLEAGY